MSLRLSRKQSAPALLLCPSQPAITEDPKLQLHRVPFIPRSFSAPAAPPTKDSLTGRDFPRGNLGRKEDNLAFAGIAPAEGLIKTSLIKSATNLPYQTIPEVNNENYRLQNPPTCRTDGGPLNSLSNFINKPILSLLTSSTEQGYQDSLIKKSPRAVVNNQTENTAHPHFISKRISSKCLQAFRKLHPSPVFPPEYRLSRCGTDSSEAQTPTNRHSWSSSSISPRTSVILKGTDADFIPPDRKEALKHFILPGNCVVDFPGTSSEAAVHKLHSCSPLQQENKGIDTNCKEKSLEVNNNPPKLSSGDKSSDCFTTGIPRKSVISAEDVSSGIGFSSYDTKNETLDTQKTYNEGKLRQKSSSIETQLVADTAQLSNCQEALKELETPPPGVVCREMNTSIRNKKQKCKSCGSPKNEPEVSLKISRLATWKGKAKLENWLRKNKYGPPITSHLPEETDSGTVRLKKSPSLLFRLWNHKESESNTGGCQQEQHLDRASIKHPKEVTSHPIQDKIATRTKKDREQVLQRADLLTLGSTSRSVRPRDSRRVFEQGIGEGQLKIQDFSMLSPDTLPNKSLGVPNLNSEKHEVVSWNGSIKEYAGSLGQVCPSGERPVSDIFRSRASDSSIHWLTETGTVPSTMKVQIESAEEPAFDDSGLVADWHAAMRMMDEFSKAEQKLKRTGAVKHKRTKRGGSSLTPDTDSGKDGIGRTFSNDQRAGPVVGDMRIRLAKDMLEDFEDSDNESAMSRDSSLIV